MSYTKIAFVFAIRMIVLRYLFAAAAPTCRNASDPQSSLQLRRRFRSEDNSSLGRVSVPALRVISPAPMPRDCCLQTGQWPDVDNGIVCGTCTALVLTAPHEGRCDKYCASFGHVCVSAADELEDSCMIKQRTKCDVQIVNTSDMLCTCRLPQETGSCQVTKRIEIVGRQLFINGRPMHLKGVAWNPVRRGCVHPFGIEFKSAVEKDAEMMARAGINVVRTYEPITDTAVLDVLWARGIWVVNSVYNYGGNDAETVIDLVNSVKHHPAILMWTIGNEWNYNGLYVDMSFEDCLARIDKVARLVKQHDPDHPVSTIYGDLGRLNEASERLADTIDVFGINAYRGIDFGNLFDAYAGVSGKPMYLGEYGADAYNSLIGAEDQASQADATSALTLQITRRTAVRNGGVCLGGFIFELTDELWKDGEGSPWDQDVGGVAPGGGPHPDLTFNEEWWGLMTIDRIPRLAFEVYSKIPVPEA